MAKAKKATRIRKELKRLREKYDDIEERRQSTVEGLIQRAAAHRIYLEDLEEDLDEHGWTELFQQGEKQKPYQRKRPEAEIYTSLNNIYQKELKQLTDLLPKDNTMQLSSGDDFDDFVISRDTR